MKNSMVPVTTNQSCTVMCYKLWWTNIAMENHHFSWENPLFQWPFSIAMLVHQRVDVISSWLSRSELHDETAPMAPMAPSDDPMDPGPQVFDFRKGLISFFSQTPRPKRPLFQALFRNPVWWKRLCTYLWANFKNKSLSWKVRPFVFFFSPPCKNPDDHDSRLENDVRSW